MSRCGAAIAKLVFVVRLQDNPERNPYAAHETWSTQPEALRQQVGNSAGQPKGIEAAAYELELEEAVRGL